MRQLCPSHPHRLTKCGHIRTGKSRGSGGRHTRNQTRSPYDENAPITVWIDADASPAFDAYVAAHPDKANLLKAVTVDREQFPAESSTIQQY
ncbi:MAG: hypothetical protein U0401_14615 [Anaerolineae bacterium]